MSACLESATDNFALNAARESHDGLLEIISILLCHFLVGR